MRQSYCPARTASMIGINAMRRFGEPFSEVAGVTGWHGFDLPQLD